MALIDVLAPAAAERVLDLGCGDGRLTAAIRDRGAEVIALDASPEMAVAAAAHGLPAVVADAAAMPVADGIVDAVFSNAALHWVSEHERLIAEIARVLAPGGRLIARTGGAGNQWRMESTALSVLASKQFHPYRPPDFRSPWTMADPRVWMAALLERGMTVDELALVSTPSGWQAADDVIHWFATVAHPFTVAMPKAVADQYVSTVGTAGWSSMDTEEPFVRLIVRARRD